MEFNIDCEVPQWKKDLIARLRNQNKQTSVSVTGSGEQLYGSPPHHPSYAAGQQPSLTCCSSESVASTSVEPGKCDALSAQLIVVEEKPSTMVSKTYTNGVHRKDSDSDSSEDLHYGPGIVNKLKNKYLSLALRENNARVRPSILRMRKATSLENLLDDDTPNGILSGGNRLFQPRLNGRSNDTAKNVPDRYRNATRGLEMKRARSVEAISLSHHDDNVVNPELIKEGNDQPYRKMHDNAKIVETTNENNKYVRVNRPKRIAPIMNEREKPPADVVKQKKMIFERSAEMRTKAPISTGDVAAKVDTYNNIIVKAKASKKPLIKHKPVLLTPSPPIRVAKPVLITNNDKVINNKTQTVKKVPKPALKDSSVPDVSIVDFPHSKASDTPDLILTSSPVPILASPTLKKSTEKFIKEEIRNSSPNKTGSAVFNFSNTQVNQSHLPVNKNVSTTKTPPSQPLNIEVNGFSSSETKKTLLASPKEISPKFPSPVNRIETPAQPAQKTDLTITEIEKNSINTAKTLEQPVSVKNGAEVSKVVVPKVKRANESAPTTAVFNFTGRKDVPDYISNDRSRSPGRPELPKAGEGGIILIPGATILESFVDEDEELRFLEGPPSPCDVEFINANILIDGKSSLKSKRSKLNISFVNSDPEIFEYPSESSLLLDDLSSPVSNSTLGHTVPNLSGSTLANYTPKGTEDFQLGMARPIQTIQQTSETDGSNTAEVIPDVEEPIVFSAGTNSDILF